jgi:hypothetical protein
MATLQVYPNYHIILPKIITNDIIYYLINYITNYYLLPYI